MKELKLKLNEKQKRFCEEYMIDLNGTQAAIRAGYSEKTAKQISSENLTKLDIQAYLAELKKNISEKLNITAEMVLNEYASIAFLDVSEFYDDNNEFKELKDIPVKARKAISKVIKTKIVKGETSIEKQGYELHDKLKALESVAKHIGFFETDNNQKKLFPEGFNINIKK